MSASKPRLSSSALTEVRPETLGIEAVLVNTSPSGPEVSAEISRSLDRETNTCSPKNSAGSRSNLEQPQPHSPSRSLGTGGMMATDRANQSLMRKLGPLAKELGTSPATLRKKLPQLYEAGFPRPCPFLESWYWPEVERWLVNASRNELRERIEGIGSEWLEAVDG